MADMDRQARQTNQRPVSDSPWFWLILFTASALAALVVVGPKYGYRQARLERMNNTREQMARRAAGAAIETDDPDALVTELPRDAARRFTLGPLATVLALVLAVAAAAAGVLGYLKSAARHQEATGKRPLE